MDGKSNQLYSLSKFQNILFLKCHLKLPADTIITSTKNLLRNLVAIKNKSQNTRINMTVQKSIERDDVCKTVDVNEHVRKKRELIGQFWKEPNSIR